MPRPRIGVRPERVTGGYAMKAVRALQVALGCAALSLAAPAASQDALPVTDPAIVAEGEAAERRGRLRWLYDQEAWQATDALLEDIDPQTVESPRGYVVVPGASGGTLETIFVAERDGTLREFARYVVRESTVEGGGPVGDLPA